MRTLKILKIVLHVWGTVTLFGAIGGTVAAVFMPTWQTVYIGDSKQLHEHGLWIDCVRDDRNLEFLNGEGGIFSCSYKFDQSPKQGGEIQHRNLSWHQSSLALFCASAFLGLVALLFAFCTICIKLCSIFWALLSVIATGSSTAGLLIFFLNSHHADYRYIRLMTLSYEQERGFAFWCALGGCLSFWMAAIVSILTSVLYFVISHREYQQYRSNKTWPSLHHNTAV